MEAFLVTAGVAAAAAGGVLLRLRFWPYERCPSCRDRPGRGWGSTDEAWNRCRRCGGTGRRIRRGSRIYRKWREEAKRR